MPETQAQPSTHSCDVLVIGGGPAGSTISTKLAEKGWNVVQLEKEHHPRFHIGESLLPMNVPILEELGVLDQVEEIGIRKYGAEFDSMYHGRMSLYYFGKALDTNHPYAYEVKREQFDEILFRNATKKGVDTREGIKVIEVTTHADNSSTIVGKDKQGNLHTFKARFLVDASGRDTFLSSKLGIKRRNKDHNSAALFGHFNNVERREGLDEGNITLSWFEHGWFWMIPFKDGEMSVGAVCWPYYLASRKVDPEQFLYDTIAMCPPVAERMKNAELVTKVSATGNYSYKSDHMVGNGYIMVGDAFAFVDPVFSSGVLLGMTSGLEGAKVVDTVLREPEKAAKVIKHFNRTVRSGIKTFSWFIYRITQPAMRDMFMSSEERKVSFKMEEAILSLLAGDIFRDTPIKRPLFIFNMLYRLTWLKDWRINLAAQRKRKTDIRFKDLPPEATKGARNTKNTEKPEEIEVN
ncbi:MAG TPA: NAD(P)/FAD-dependent oxidoreductase [Porticoccus sp.]|nr:NAD(P)/FAD-dependent oxidoreductase [Porticoccus sp.]